MKVKINKKIKQNKGVLVVLVFKEYLKKFPTNYPEIIKNFIKQLEKNKEFKAKRLQTISTYIGRKELPEKVLIIGLGESKKFNVRGALEAGGKIGKHIKAIKEKEGAILIPKEIADLSGQLILGMLMAQYNVDSMKSKNKNKYEFEKLEIVTDENAKNLEKAIEKAEILNNGAKYVKDLVNAPSNMVNSEYLAKEAKRIAKENKCKIVVLNQKDLKKMQWGALLAVNQGSKNEAKCIVLQYDGAKDRKEKPLVIVGKGIMFDTGGYNLKPTNYIETMQQDMAGGATVLGVFEVLKKIGIKKNVIGVIPVAENLISATSYRPSDIIKSFAGLTIEITNTDAEGRLILADAITYATRLKPEAIITIATLTGAVVVATGDRYAGLFGNNIKLRNALQKAGRETDELGWPLPIHRDYRKKIDSKVADIRNYDLGSGKYAGASKAAAFLERFVEKNKWCHIDIAGTAFTDDPKEYQTMGATAHGLQMLIKYLE